MSAAGLPEPCCGGVTVTRKRWLSLKTPSVTVTVAVWVPRSASTGDTPMEAVPSPWSLRLMNAGPESEKPSPDPGVSASLAVTARYWLVSWAA